MPESLRSAPHTALGVESRSLQRRRLALREGRFRALPRDLRGGFLLPRLRRAASACLPLGPPDLVPSRPNDPQQRSHLLSTSDSLVTLVKRSLPMTHWTFKRGQSLRAESGISFWRPSCACQCRWRPSNWMAVRGTTMDILLSPTEGTGTKCRLGFWTQSCSAYASTQICG